VRKSFQAALVLVAAGALILRAQDAPKDAPIDTLEKKVGYAVGYQTGKNLRDQGGSIDADAMARGLRDGLAGIAPAVSEDVLEAAIREFSKALQGKAAKVHGERLKVNKEAGAAFLAKNKSEEGVQTTQSGLQYKVLKEGDGPKPKASDTVVVNYEGKLIDGTVFDSSYKRGMPLTFQVGGVIKGWTEGLQLMNVGSTYMLYIPSDLAYGDDDHPGGIIKGGSTLVFKVELLEIKKGK
jgi:FKBP-type peptidyl-prolyl cis-trans isomerase